MIQNLRKSDKTLATSKIYLITDYWFLMTVMSGSE